MWMWWWWSKKKGRVVRRQTMSLLSLRPPCARRPSTSFWLYTVDAGYWLLMFKAFDADFKATTPRFHACGRPSHSRVKAFHHYQCQSSPTRRTMSSLTYLIRLIRPVRGYHGASIFTNDTGRIVFSPSARRPCQPRVLIPFTLYHAPVPARARGHGRGPCHGPCRRGQGWRCPRGWRPRCGSCTQQTRSSL